MRKLTILIIGILFIPIVFASTLNRQLPSSVQPNQPFTVTYSTVNAPSTKWFVAWVDLVSGCTPSPYQDFMASTTGGDKSVSVTYKSPSSGNCVFSGGYFQFADESKQYWSSQTVIISSTPPPCTSSWSCGSWSSCTDSQQTRTCTDTNGCQIDKTETQSCGTPTICTTDDDCEFYEKCTDGTCKFNKTYLILLIFIIVISKM